VRRQVGDRTLEPIERASISDAAEQARDRVVTLGKPEIEHVTEFDLDVGQPRARDCDHLRIAVESPASEAVPGQALQVLACGRSARKRALKASASRA
jgi:hypothetical protein